MDAGILSRSEWLRAESLLNKLRAISRQDLLPSIDRFPLASEDTPTSEPVPRKIFETLSARIENRQRPAGIALYPPRSEMTLHSAFRQDVHQDRFIR